jgi:hypothetical protein
MEGTRSATLFRPLFFYKMRFLMSLVLAFNYALMTFFFCFIEFFIALRFIHLPLPL